MSMFDDLDDAFAPSAGAALEDVARRVQAKRVRRRIAAASTITVTCVVALASVAFATPDASHTSVQLTAPTSTEPGVTTAPPGRAYLPPTTTPMSTLAPEVPTPTTTANSFPVPPAPSTTAETTVPAPGVAELHVHFDEPEVTMQAGTWRTVTLTVANDGTATGSFQIPCRDTYMAVGLLTTTLLPIPPQDPNCPAQPTNDVAPGASVTLHETLLAGQPSGGGIVPSMPGTVCFTVPIPGHQPNVLYQACDPDPAFRDVQLRVKITPGATPLFTTTRPTDVTVGSGTETIVPFTLTNNLPVAADYRFWGPNTTPESNDASVCGPLWGDNACDIVVNAHSTVTLHLHVWGSQDGISPPSPTNPARAAGQFTVDWNEVTLHVTVA